MKPNNTQKKAYEEARDNNELIDAFAIDTVYRKREYPVTLGNKYKVLVLNFKKEPISSGDIVAYYLTILDDCVYKILTNNVFNSLFKIKNDLKFPTDALKSRLLYLTGMYYKTFEDAHEEEKFSYLCIGDIDGFTKGEVYKGVPTEFDGNLDELIILDDKTSPAILVSSECGMLKFIDVEGNFEEVSQVSFNHKYRVIQHSPFSPHIAQEFSEEEIWTETKGKYPWSARVRTVRISYVWKNVYGIYGSKPLEFEGPESAKKWIKEMNSKEYPKIIY